MVGVVILAAGASTRLGKAKQLALLGGETLLDRAVRTATEAGCGPVIVVLGARAVEIQAQCRLQDCRVVLNEAWADGMGTSIRAGSQVLAGRVAGVILMTCDQPAVTPEHLRRLIAANEANETPVAVGSAYAGRIGVPAFFPAEQFGLLLNIKGDQGARDLLRSTNAVGLADGELDVDTVEALQAARLRFG